MGNALGAHTVVVLFAIGTAALALWLLVRFPSFGPHSLRWSLIAALVGVVVDQPLLLLLGAVRTASGPGAALIVVGIPLFTMLFWTSGCLVRAAVLNEQR